MTTDLLKGNWRPVSFRLEQDCFVCTSHAVNSRGYPVITEGGKRYLIARWLWIKLFGDIDPGLVVRHDCDNKLCINPAHLRLGTHKDNMIDAQERRRMASGERNGATHLTEEDVWFIRGKQASQRTLAAMFGISQQGVCDIQKGEKAWKYLS